MVRIQFNIEFTSNGYNNPDVDVKFQPIQIFHKESMDAISSTFDQAFAIIQMSVCFFLFGPFILFYF